MSAWYSTSPQIIHLLPLHLFQKKLTDLAVLVDQATIILKVDKALVRGTSLGAGKTDHQACTLNEKGVPACQSLDHLARLMIQKARKLGEGEDHLTEMIELTDVAISPPPRKLTTRMLRLMPSILAQMPQLL